MVCILITTKGRKYKSRPTSGWSRTWRILPVNVNYRHLKGDPDLEVGTRPAAKPLNQGVSRSSDLSRVNGNGIYSSTICSCQEDGASRTDIFRAYVTKKPGVRARLWQRVYASPGGDGIAIDQFTPRNAPW